jgi:phage N-6-adenine-methyltransferase
VSLVGFRARNHPQQSTRDDVDDRRTPASVFGPLHAGRRFTVDAAASHANALLPAYWTREVDGLTQSWGGHRVWCNPPYSGLAPWLAKAWAEMLHGGCESVTMLVPANRCEQRWWQDHVEPYRDGAPRDGVRLSVRFLPGRMRFDWPPGRVVPPKGDRPPFGVALLTWARPALTVGVFRGWLARELGPCGLVRRGR